MAHTTAYNLLIPESKTAPTLLLYAQEITVFWMDNKDQISFLCVMSTFTYSPDCAQILCSLEAILI